MPTENLTLSAAYTYLDAKYKDLQPITGSASNNAAADNTVTDKCTVVDTPGTAPGTSPTCQLNLSNNYMEDVPEHALVSFAGYDHAFFVHNINWFLEGDAIYQDKRYESSFNDVEFGEYWLFNLRAGLRGDRWDVTAFIDNVADDDTIQTGFRNPDARFITSGFPFNGTYLRPNPRQYGLRMNYRFGGGG
jgi:hypothetical protein